MKPPIPPNEAARLQALHEYRILDTPQEQLFDDLTLLASFVTSCPIALLSLVDQNRQWFKSKVGVSASETVRDIAFCAWAILETHTFIVPDASADERFKDNPLVTAEPHVRFYAGVQLTNSEGFALGTLCVMDQQPRELTPEQKAALDALGRQAISQLALRRASADLAQALENVNVLSGLLPICAHCKKIRDDQNYWKDLEVYIGAHSDASFSHGICPGCLEKFYPEVAKKLQQTR